MFTLGAIANELGGVLNGSAELEITSLGDFDDSVRGQLVVAFDSKAVAICEDGPATAVVVPTGMKCRLPTIEVDNIQTALVHLLHFFAPPATVPTGIHPTAVIHESATLGADVSIAAFVVIEKSAIVGDRSCIGAHTVIGANASVGADVLMHANVTIYDNVEVGDRVVLHSGAVIGGNGFGFHSVSAEYKRVPQIGRVVLEDDVEIGCNSCVDRATIGVTQVGRGTKIDNLVQVGHNNRIGKHVMLCGQVGLAGSSRIGDFVVLGGQAGVGDHLTIGDGAQLGGNASALFDIEPGAKLMGTPAIPIREYLSISVLLRKLRELFKRVAKLEKLAK